MKTINYKAKFTEGVLATKPNDAQVHETYVAAKKCDGISSDELDAAERTTA